MAQLIKTRHPGIYKRGGRYMVIYRDRTKKQRSETCDTLAEAQRVKAERVAAVKNRTHRQVSVQPFPDYVTEWIETYTGHKGGSFREHTRREYRRIIGRYLVPFFDGYTLGEIATKDVRAFGLWLQNDELQGELKAEVSRKRLAAKKGVSPDSLPLKPKPVTLADGTVSRIVTTLSAALTTAVNDGLIDRNPVRDAAIPKRDQQRAIDEGRDGDDDQVKAMTDDELAAFLAACPDTWQPFFRLLAATGLRWSEAIALQWRHVDLESPAPCVKVRRAYVKGEYGPPKSKTSKRQVPIGPDVIRHLKAHRAASEWHRADDLVFPSEAGTPLRQENVRRRVLWPTAKQAGLVKAPEAGKGPVTWVGFHTFRHTCATRLFLQGRNAKQVQRWLGHHSAAFTLEVYVHLLDGDLDGPIEAPDVAPVAVPDQVPGDRSIRELAAA